MKEIKFNILELESTLEKLEENPPKPKEAFYTIPETGYYSVNAGPPQLLEKDVIYKVNQDGTLEKL